MPSIIITNRDKTITISPPVAVNLEINKIDQSIVLLSSGLTGQQGEPGEGVPIGGTIGQYLRKDSSTDYDTSWDTLTASDITDFDTEVSNNVDVSANTTARHTHANKTILDNTTASFTTADETKLDGIESGAQVNTVNSVAGKTGNVTLLSDRDWETVVLSRIVLFA